MPSPKSERAVVHVVDDDASMRDALEGLFESVGLDTRTYAAAGEFLAARLVDKPGCIVIDVRLPDINGLDFHAQLIQSGVRLPVVVITGYGDIPMSVRAMKRGAVDFLSKHIQRSGHARRRAGRDRTRSTEADGRRRCLANAAALRNAVSARAAGHAAGHLRQDEQAGRR